MNIFIFRIKRSENYISDKKILQLGILSSSDFSYEPIEPEKFGEQLDDLIRAIQEGDQSGVLNAAKGLSGQVNNLKGRQMLESEALKLNDQTRALLDNAKKALKEEDSQQAKKKMEQLVADMKRQVTDMSLQEKKMMDARALLNKNANGLGLAMQNMSKFLTGNVSESKSGNMMEDLDNLKTTNHSNASATDFDDLDKELDSLDIQDNQKNNSKPSSSSDMDDLDALEAELDDL